MKRSTRRALAKGALIALALVILTVGVCYLSGVLFLLANKVNPLRAHVFSIASYWNLYSEDAALRKRLSGSIAIAALVGYVVLPAMLLGGTVRRRPLHGDARFANAAQVRRSGLLSATFAAIAAKASFQVAGTSLPLLRT